MKILITDQFFGPSPRELQLHPIPFEQLIQEVLDDKERKPTIGYMKPEVRDIEVSSTFRVPYGTTVWYADKDGYARVFSINWDSSG